MTETHTLAVGKPTAAKYGRLGFSKEMTCPLSRQFIFIAGTSGTGKSCLLQSFEEAYIFNLDLTPTTANPMRATIWPGLDPTSGVPIDVGGTPLNLTWEDVVEKKDLLMSMANNNQPRPQLVVLDTLGTTLQMVMRALAKKYGKPAFKDLDGRRAYSEMYDIIVDFALDLRRVGYGVCFITHITNETIQLGEDRNVIQPTLTITGGFWKRILPLVDFSGVIFAKWKTTTEKVEMPGPIIKGKKTTFKKDVSTKVREHVLTVKKDIYEGITKCRHDMSDVVLPAADSWAALEEAYNSSSPT